MLVRKIDGNFSDWVEVADVVCPPIVVTDAEEDEEVVVEEVDEVGTELVVVVVSLVEVVAVEVVGVVEVVVLLPVPVVVVLTEPMEPMELVEEVNIPPNPIMRAAARTITTIAAAMVILPMARLSWRIERSCPIITRRLSCNLVVPEILGRPMEIQ